MAVDARTRRVAWQFVRFCLVGGSGVAVNTALLVVLHDFLRLALLIASPIAVEVSILNNYLWNSLWTFKRSGAGSRGIEPRRLAKFNLVSLGGLAITTGVLDLLAQNGHLHALFLPAYTGLHYLLANLIAIGMATLWNFALNFLWTWGSA